MARIDDVIVGLQIIQKYEPNSWVQSEHDEIFAGSEVTKEKATPEDLERLKECGWRWNAELPSFAKFT